MTRTKSVTQINITIDIKIVTEQRVRDVAN